MSKQSEIIDLCEDSLCVLKKIGQGIFELKTAVSQEASANFYSSATWALIVAVAILFLSYVELRKTSRASNVNFLLSSNSEYVSIFVGLCRLQDVRDSHWKTVLSKLDVVNFDPEMFELVKRYDIDNEIWEEIRKVKNYYKTRYSLIGKDHFADWAIYESLNRYGADNRETLARNMDLLKRVEAHRFYRVRPTDWNDAKESDTSANYVESFDRFQGLFEKEMLWYDAILAFMDEPKARIRRWKWLSRILD